MFQGQFSAAVTSGKAERYGKMGKDMRKGLNESFLLFTLIIVPAFQKNKIK